MHRKIIVGHDLHDGGDDAVALGRQLAEACGAELVVAGVVPFGVLPHGFEWRDDEEEVVARIEGLAEAAGAKPEAVPGKSPAGGLHDLAEETGADLIVIGSSRHSSAHQVLAGNVGGQADQVVRIAVRGRHSAARLSPACRRASPSDRGRF